jgi:hypothetical protein
LVRVVSYRLIDDAAGSKPESIQEPGTGNRDRDNHRHNPFGRHSSLDRREYISRHHEREGHPERGGRNA